MQDVLISTTHSFLTSARIPLKTNISTDSRCSWSTTLLYITSDGPFNCLLSISTGRVQSPSLSPYLVSGFGGQLSVGTNHRRFPYVFSRTCAKWQMAFGSTAHLEASVRLLIQFSRSIKLSSSIFRPTDSYTWAAEQASTSSFSTSRSSKWYIRDRLSGCSPPYYYLKNRNRSSSSLAIFKVCPSSRLRPARFKSLHRARCMIT